MVVISLCHEIGDTSQYNSPYNQITTRSKCSNLCTLQHCGIYLSHDRSFTPQLPSVV